MVNACGVGLFGKDEQLGEAGRDIYIMIFAVIANLVKVTSGKRRSHEDKSCVLPRDIASKILSYELLLHFLEYWRDEQEAVTGLRLDAFNSAEKRSIITLSFAARRMIVPSLLSNTRCALEDPKVFRCVIRIVSELWCSPFYRSCCKIELCVLIDHFVLRMLQLGPQFIACKSVDLDSELAHLSLLAQQVELIREIRNWFTNDPKDVVEMYLNYDTDFCAEITSPTQLIAGTQMKTFQRLCAGLSSIAEKCSDIIGEQIRENQNKIRSESETIAEMSKMIESMNDCGKVCVDKASVREAARLLRKVSFEAISQIVKSLAISAAAGIGPDFTNLLLSWTQFDSTIGYETIAPSPFQSNESCTQNERETPGPESTTLREGFASPVQKEMPSETESCVSASHLRNVFEDRQPADVSAAVPTSQESLHVALDIARDKSLKKAIEYLIACGVLSAAPRDIANFLQLNKDNLEPANLGDYLSEGGVGGDEVEYWNSIRALYVRCIAFVGMNVEEG
jgi:hypothetical protein